MLNPTHANAYASVTVNSERVRAGRISRGQTAVEFALSLTLMFIVLLVGVQFALIGQAALSLSQGASAIARYAAVYEPQGKISATYSGTPNSDMQNLLSPSILTGAGGGDLTVTINSYKGGTTSSPATDPMTPSADRAIVTLSYNASSKIILPNPFLGIITFPTALSASDSQLYE
jgi:Flp pilus assembly protein TadG